MRKKLFAAIAGLSVCSPALGAVFAERDCVPAILKDYPGATGFYERHESRFDCGDGCVGTSTWRHIEGYLDGERWIFGACFDTVEITRDPPTVSDYANDALNTLYRFWRDAVETKYDNGKEQYYKRELTPVDAGGVRGIVLPPPADVITGASITNDRYAGSMMSTASGPQSFVMKHYLFKGQTEFSVPFVVKARQRLDRLAIFLDDALVWQSSLAVLKVDRPYTATFPLGDHAGLDAVITIYLQSDGPGGTQVFLPDILVEP